MNSLLPVLGGLGVIGALVTAFMGALMFQSGRAKAALDESASLITQSKTLSDRITADYDRIRQENERLHGLVEDLTTQNLELGRQVAALQIQVDRITAQS